LAKRVIHKRYSVYSLALAGLLAAFVYSSYDNETELSPTEFMNML
jgi:hypothetical protein